MAEIEAPKIEFPCLYPIKVVGDATEDFQAFVLDVLERHAGSILDEHIELNPSRTGRFVSVRVSITATGPEQLQAIFEELKASGRVHMVL